MAEQFDVGRAAYSPPTWHMLNCVKSPLLLVERKKTHVLHRCPACPQWFYWESK